MTEVSSPSSLLAIEDALSCIAAHVTPLAPERVVLEDAYGRFLAEDLCAPLDLPPFRNSAMDGYAVRAADTPGRLTVLGESAAGAPHLATVAPGVAVKVSTGATMPEGTDAVAPIETVTVRDGEIEIADSVAPGTFVRDRGSDIARGAPLLAAHTRIGPAQIGAAAASGLRTLPCRRLPRVAIVTTGNELRRPGEPLRDGEIYDANGPMLEAALHAAGARVERFPAAADTLDAHAEALSRALTHDVVITSGGVSVGDHDLVRRAGAELGVRELFWRIALRPGKPLTFGVRDGTLVFGLPGNPVSTLVCFQMFVAPALLALQGAPDCRPAFRVGMLAAEVARNPVRDDLIRVRVRRPHPEDDGPVAVPVLEPLPGQQSHQIVVAAQADGLARIPTGEGPLAPGAEVEYLPIDVLAAGRG
jgi:molybdopterin molybdotransferase